MTLAAIAVEAASDFDQAKRRWTDFQSQREQLRLHVEAIEAALQLTDARTATSAAPVSDVLSTRAARILEGQTLSPRRLRQMLDEAVEQVDVLAAQVAAEAQAWAIARDLEHERVAITLQPRHRAAVVAIASAVAALSVAIGQERAVREEFAATGLAPLGSALLPDASSALGVGMLDEFHSRASAWARDMHRIGVLR